ncbi:MAG: hypothetical protein QM529_02185 [Hydrotalea sp.]|nr:hypothetical protein [Hydrotalea sp.]
MLKKNFVFILFYFAVALVIGISLYFYSPFPPYNIVICTVVGYFLACLLHVLLVGGRPKKSTSGAQYQPFYPSTIMDNDELDGDDVLSNEPARGTDDRTANKLPQSATRPNKRGDVDDSSATMVITTPRKMTSKPVNALQDIFKSAYQNDLLAGGRAMVMFGHDVVEAKGRQPIGFYCQGYIEYHNGQGRDIAGIIADSPRNTVAGDLEILLLETLRHYWQKILQGVEVGDLPYCFFPLSERALNEKGFINDLKSFLKSQKIAYPRLSRAFSRLVIVLPFTSGLYRHAEACQFLSSEGIKLGMIYSSGNTTLLNPILDDDPSLLLRMGIDFYLLSVDDLQFLQEKLGYETMSEKILSLEKLRLMTMVFNIDDERVYNSLPYGLTMVMGKLFDKQTLLARLPLKNNAGGDAVNDAGNDAG